MIRTEAVPAGENSSYGVQRTTPECSYPVVNGIVEIDYVDGNGVRVKRAYPINPEWKFCKGLRVTEGKKKWHGLYPQPDATLREWNELITHIPRYDLCESPLEFISHSMMLGFADQLFAGFSKKAVFVLSPQRAAMSNIDEGYLLFSKRNPPPEGMV